MKVHFPNGRDLTNDNSINAAGHEKIAGTQSVGRGFSLDISGRDKDINAFGMEELKSVKDVRDKASVKDVSLEHNALAVMSNCMSGEDFARLQEDGYSPDNMDIEETVTSLDKIKATLIQSGVSIPGYTDDLSTEQIEAITGSPAYAAVIEAALKDNLLPVNADNVSDIDDVIKTSQSLSPLSDSAMKYMVSNEMPLTVENMYMANHSSYSAEDGGRRSQYYKDAAGYIGRNADAADIEGLRPQIEKIIEDSGMDVTDETMNSSQWLIEHNLPLTADNLLKLSDINSLSFTIDIDTVARSCAAALSDGAYAKEAVLTNTESQVSRAAHITAEMLKEITNTEESLRAEEARIDAIEDGGIADISKHRLLEETRLYLTVEANLTLLKKGISVDTKDLEMLVETLKQAERDYYRSMLVPDKEGDADTVLTTEDALGLDEELDIKILLYKQTTRAVAAVKAAPDDIAAEALNNPSLSELSEKADALKADYDKAGKSYETMMTTVRKDLGDSIKKAFRNVDDILEDLDIEVNRLNEKAVRILGYAGMEINEENIDRALSAEIAVENIISKMTPARTLKMIRDGVNPLEENVYDLSDRLNSEDAEEEANNNVKYSEFLLRLEKSGEITEAEKTSFIGIYRLLNKLEKSDGKYLGEAIKSGERADGDFINPEDRLTFSNIITASRSDRKLNMDIKIDESFGALEKLITHGESITDQILAGLKNDKDADDSYNSAKASEIRNALNTESQVLDILSELNEPASPVNIEALTELVRSKGTVFKGLSGVLSDEDAAYFDSEAVSLIEGFTDEENAREGYEQFTARASEIIKNASENADKYIDLRSLKLVNKQLTIASKAAQYRTYEIPVNIDGELTGINLKLICDSVNAGKAEIAFETDALGKVSAELTLRDGKASVFIVSENTDAYDEFAEGEDGFAARLSGELDKVGISVQPLYRTAGRGFASGGRYIEEGGRETAETKMLYNAAKAVIKALRH